MMCVRQSWEGGDKVPWMPEMFLYRNPWWLWPQTVLLNIGLISLWNIPLSDSSCCSTGARGGKQVGMTPWVTPAVRVKNLAQRQRCLIGIHCSPPAKASDSKQEGVTKSMWWNLLHLHEKDWGCDFLSSYIFANTQVVNTADIIYSQLMLSIYPSLEKIYSRKYSERELQSSWPIMDYTIIIFSFGSEKGKAENEWNMHQGL